MTSTGKIVFDFAKMEAAEISIGQRGGVYHRMIDDMWGTLMWKGSLHRSALYYLLALNLAYYDLLGLEVVIVILLSAVFTIRTSSESTTATAVAMSEAYRICVDLSGLLEYLSGDDVMSNAFYGLGGVLGCGLLLRLFGSSLSDGLHFVRIPLIIGIAAVTIYNRFFVEETASESSSHDGAGQESSTTATSTVTAQPGEEPQPEAITAKTLELFKRPGWNKINHIDDCTLEDNPVEFCDKKAIRITTSMGCSIDSFRKTMTSTDTMYRYDPMLRSHELIKVYSNGVSILYSNYKQATKLIAARDFVTMNGSRELSTEEIRDYGFAPAGENCRVFVTGALNDTSKPAQKGFTRGIIHVYGYIAVQKEGEEKITVYLVASVDPSGRIPGWLVDAGNADNCRKLAKIRSLCESDYQAMQK
eukprot:PhM_4_TR776/c0_g2_i1/m.91302